MDKVIDPPVSSSLPTNSTLANTTTITATPVTNMSSVATQTSAATTLLVLTPPPIEDTPPTINKIRKKSASSQGRSPAESSRPILSISPSSLEYQLTANLLNYHQPAPPSSSYLGEASRPRSKSQPQKTRRGTTGWDALISPKTFLASSQSTGHRHISNRDKNTNGPGNDLQGKKSHTTIEELTPISSSVPSSPTVIQSPFGLFQSSSSSSSEKPENSQLNPSPPLPPLPPHPPKSPSSLIAHYFPGSLPPPPSRGRAPLGLREPLVAPTPFKTPTFGPSILSSPYQDGNAPPMPSPSASFHYIPSANISRCSTAQTHSHEDCELLCSSNRPSPSTSALGFSTSANKARQTQRIPSDLDLLMANNSRVRFHNQQFNNNYNNNRNQPINNFSIHNNPSDNPAESEATFSAIVDRGLSTISSGSTTCHRLVMPAPTTPIYPRGLMSTNGGPLAENPLIIRLQHKAVPYVRELVPGKDGLHSGLSSANTSHDLEIIIEEITGRLRTNRTSTDPWPYYISPWDEKPLPPLRREKGNRYWIFRDHYGIVPGPFFFLLGHLLPILWWIGSVYPNIEHPDNLTMSERAREEQENARSTDDDLSNHNVIQWLQRRLSNVGATITSITTTTSKQSATTTLEISRISHETDREGSTIEPSYPNPANINAIPPPIEDLPLDTHGPWSADDHASSLFEQRMEHDRKVLRYELDQRWKKINIIWSIGSFVLAITVTAVIVCIL
ncbi:hypothetical protein BGX27_003048 [Mortierella sp. AM989]|nr:hypothetical protein BGX27_003048 [Mortierella sp. AM989]